MSGRVVDFSVAMKPVSARFEIKAPTPDGRTETSHIASAGALLLKVLTMPLQEREEIMKAAANDEVAVLFAILTPEERRGIVQAATTQLKEDITKI